MLPCQYLKIKLNFTAEASGSMYTDNAIKNQSQFNGGGYLLRNTATRRWDRQNEFVSSDGNGYVSNQHDQWTVLFANTFLFA